MKDYTGDGISPAQEAWCKRCEECTDKGEWKQPIGANARMWCAASEDDIYVRECPSVGATCQECIVREDHMEYAGEDGQVFCAKAEKHIATNQCWARQGGLC